MLGAFTRDIEEYKEILKVLYQEQNESFYQDLDIITLSIDQDSMEAIIDLIETYIIENNGQLPIAENSD